MDPGTYRMFVGRDSAGAWISADVTVDGPHWKDGDFPVVSDQDAGTYAGFGAYQPCCWRPAPGARTTRRPRPWRRLPTGLPSSSPGSHAAPSSRSPHRTKLFDRPATHLRLRIDVACPGYYRVAHSAVGERGITYQLVGPTAVNVVIDFWVLDVGGVPVVVDQWHNVDAPSGLVDQAREARESITFVEDE